MAPARFEHETEIAVPRATLHAFLCDLDNYVPLHPLIESIRALPARPERPRARRYRVVDQIPVGPFRMRTVYTAELEPISDYEVRGEAWQSPGIHLLTVYQLEERGPATRLREQVTLRAPFGLRRFVHRQARDSHGVTLEKMKALLEGRAQRA